MYLFYSCPQATDVDETDSFAPTAVRAFYVNSLII
jgi:hypothetical protein